MIDIEQVLRDGPLSLMFGTQDGQPVLFKGAAPVVPWLDTESAFHGGRGLVPPFVPLLDHEAAAWRRVDPGMVLGQGQSADGTWLALRRLPGRSLRRDGGQVRALLRSLATRLARLHAHDILHRDLRAANVIEHQGGFTLVDLDVARVGGVGPAGLVGAHAPVPARGALW